MLAVIIITALVPRVRWWLVLHRAVPPQPPGGAQRASTATASSGYDLQKVGDVNGRSLVGGIGEPEAVTAPDGNGYTQMSLSAAARRGRRLAVAVALLCGRDHGNDLAPRRLNLWSQLRECHG